MGFGWSFYGFFAAAVVWLVGYFAWAFAVRDSAGNRTR
jgi:hypothetical protein